MKRGLGASAKERARRVWWSEAARRARQAMRERGLMPGPWIDDVAGKRRGHNVPDQIGRLADELRAAGVSEETIRAVIVDSVVHIVQTSQDPGPRAA